MKLKKTKKKVIAAVASAVCFAAMLTTTAYASGDVAGAVTSTWNTARSQIVSVVNNVVFPCLDVILAVLLFMKKRVLVGMATLLLSLSLLMAQEIPAGVITAFKRGSSQELSKYMGDKVNLVLQGRSTSVDKQKATAMMQEFFTENKVSGFNVNHQGDRKSVV